MRVVAAKFTENRQARAARDAIERELDDADVDIAPLAHPGEAASGDALLAGRFPEDQAQIAVELVERSGGEVVVDIDESWTTMNSASAGQLRPSSTRRSPRYRFD